MDTKNQVLVEIKVTQDTKIKIDKLVDLRKELEGINKEQKFYKEAGMDKEYKKNAVQVENLKQEISKLNKEVNNEIKLAKSAAGSHSALEQAMIKSKLAYKAMSDQVKNSPVGVALKKQLDQQTLAFQKSAESMKEHQFNVGNYKSVWAGITKAFGLVSAAIIAVGTAVKWVKTIIEASDVVSDKFTETLTGMKGALNALNLTIVNGDWKNLIRNMQNANEAGKEYAKGIDEIEEATAALRVTEGKLNLEISQQKTLARDVTKTYSERKKAAELALKDEEIILNKRLALAKKGYDVQAKTMAKLGDYGVGRYEVVDLLTGDTNDPAKMKTIMERTSEVEREALLNAYAKLYEVKTDYYDKTLRLHSLRGKLIKAMMDGEIKDIKKEADEEYAIYQQNMEAQKDYYDNFIERAKNFVDTRLKTETDALNTQADIDIANAELTIKNADTLAKEKLRIQIQLLKDLLKVQIAYYDNNAELTDTQETKLIEKAKKAIELLEKQLNEYVPTVKEDWLATLLGIDDKSAEKIKEQVAQVKAILDELQNYRNQKLDNQQKSEDRAFNKEKDRIEKSHKSQVEKTKALEKLERDHAQKQYELALKQWKTNQEWAYTQAVIYTALAAVKGFIEGGWVDAALATALGLAQILAISTQEPPQAPGYKKGKIIPGQGNSDTHNANLTPGEAVVTKNAVSMFPRQLNAMNIAGGGDPLFGGYSANAAASGVMTDYQMISAIESAIANAPAPYVSWQEMKKFDAKMTRMVERARA